MFWLVFSLCYYQLNIYSLIGTVLEHINTSLLEVDPILHLVLFRASPESEYSLLIPWVPAPVILTGISMRIESLKNKSAQQKVSN